MRVKTHPRFRSAVIYVLVEFPECEFVKVGMTSNFPQRLQTLVRGGARHLEEQFVSEPMPWRRALDIERRLHKALRPYRARGEWYDVKTMLVFSMLRVLGVDIGDFAQMFGAK